MNATAPELSHIARQPILDSAGHVYGYELLYRGTRDATACIDPVGNISAKVMSDLLSGPTLDTLVDDRRAFLNLSTEVLLADAGSLVEPHRVVLEILETVDVTAEVIEMCRSLPRRGYAIALDDFVEGSGAEALLPYAAFVKLDVMATPPSQVEALTRRLVARNIAVVAEKVETPADFARTRQFGCSLFQGYYFCRPETFSVATLSVSQIAHLQLLTALMRPEVSMATVEDLLKRDTSLSYRVLRCVNSAASGLHREIHSIREALVLLGLDRIRKWVSLWTLAALNRGPSELVTMSIVRARACEVIGNALGRANQGYFLLGLCSLLDVLLGRPMEEVIAELPVSADLRHALLGGDNDERRVLDAVALHERGAWLESSTSAAAAGLPEHSVAEAYHEALAWAHAIARVAAPA